MHRVVHDIRQRGPAHLAIAVVLALGVSACGKRDRVSGAPETKATASTASAPVFAARARATTRPQRYRYRIVGHVAVYGFRRDGSGTGWGAYFRVSPRLPLRTDVDRTRFTLVLRDLNSNKVLSDSDPLDRFPHTRHGAACYLADFDATNPEPLSRAHDIDRVRVSLERLSGKPLGTSSRELAAPHVRPVLTGGKRRQGERALRKAGCLS
jgi:hypothetical protein